MLTLGIDSSGRTASCALAEDGVLLGEYSTNIGLTHSETLLPMIQELFARCGRRCEALSLVAVSAGPGSFTGLRIGAASGKGIALAYGIPMAAVSTLEGLCRNVAESERFVHPIMDARRHQVYTAEYLGGVLRGEEEAVSIEELVARLNREGGKHLFLGDGVAVYRAYIESNMTAEHSFASAGNLLQRAGSIALLGEQMLERGKTVESGNFTLSYVRKPQAERERERQGLREFDMLHQNNADSAERTLDRSLPRNYRIGGRSGYENEESL